MECVVMDSCSKKTVRFVEPTDREQANPSQRGEGARPQGTPPAPASSASAPDKPGSREKTGSSQGQTSGPVSAQARESGQCLDGQTAPESKPRSAAEDSQSPLGEKEAEADKKDSTEEEPQDNKPHIGEQEYLAPGELDPQNGTYFIDTRSYLRKQQPYFTPERLFATKQISVYALSPVGQRPTIRGSDKLLANSLRIPIPKSEYDNSTKHAYLVIDSVDQKPNTSRPGSKSEVSYLKIDPKTQVYRIPVKALRQNSHGAVTSQTFPSVTTKSPNIPTTSPSKMSYVTGMEIYSPVSTATLSRAQEREELQRLNDRFAAYVQRVRMLAEQNNQVDSSAILKSTKALEDEINNIKNLYEQELEKVRKELEQVVHDKTAHHVQLNKQLQYNAELQDRLSIEVDKNQKLLDEINNYQRRISAMESEIHDLRIASSRPGQDIDQLHRSVENLTREVETWKHRYEHEQVARQEAETRIQQMMQKMEFNDKVSAEHVAELHTRIESSAATILSLESKVRELSKTDVSVSELLKQVRETAEAELKKFQLETEEQYNRNLSVLKAQIDSDAKALERFETERTQLRGGIGELQAKIRSLEGQVANLEHQKQTLEDAVAVERNRAADSVRSLERKLREVQDQLIAKMREVTSAREQNIPLKAEIEALKALLEEEERRVKLISMVPPKDKQQSPRPGSPAKSAAEGLRVPLGITSASGATTPVPPTSFMSAYNIPTTATAASAANTIATAPTTYPPTTATYPTTSAGITTSAGQTVNFVPEMQTRPYVPSPPLSVTYVPDQLQTVGGPSAAYDSMFVMPRDDEYDPHLYGYTSSVPLAKYSYETSPSLNRLQVEPSPPTTPRPVGPVRAKSAPVERQRNINLVPTNLGQGRDYFDEMFHDLQRDTLYSKGRPKSSPNKRETDRPLSSLYNDYAVSTSSAIGDLKISEVSQDGKFVRVLNDGVQEVEFGGYMLQQNVGGHPVAVFRFPPRTKFAPNSVITVYAGCNDYKLHNPPTDFVWKEQQKWGTGPECTTILCRPNGQAVAWTTAAHRFTRDAFQEVPDEPDEEVLAEKVDDEGQADDGMDNDSLTEINMNINGPKPDPVYLRREKQPPPSLQAGKHPHGTSPASPVHPQNTPPRPYRYGNDNSSHNRQSRSQTTRPDPIQGQPYAGASAQKMGSAPLRKYVSGVSSTQPTIRGNGTVVNKSVQQQLGEASETPSPFMKPHSRFQSGLDQVQSQHHADFLPPMPRPPLFSTW